MYAASILPILAFLATANAAAINRADVLVARNAEVVETKVVNGVTLSKRDNCWFDPFGIIFTCSGGSGTSSSSSSSRASSSTSASASSSSSASRSSSSSSAVSTTSSAASSSSSSASRSSSSSSSSSSVAVTSSSAAAVSSSSSSASASRSSSASASSSSSAAVSSSSSVSASSSSSVPVSSSASSAAAVTSSSSSSAVVSTSASSAATVVPSSSSSSAAAVTPSSSSVAAVSPSSSSAAVVSSSSSSVVVVASSSSAAVSSSSSVASSIISSVSAAATQTSSSAVVTTSTSSAVPTTTSTATSSTSSVAAIPTNVAVSGWKYSSDIMEGTNGRALTAAATAGQSMTVETCLAYCDSLNFPLAGLEYGAECYCGTVLSNGASTSKTGQATMSCAGNAKELCGGPSVLSLYVSTKSNAAGLSSDYTSQAVSLPAGWSSNNCIQEVSGRALVEKSTASDDMTINKCLAFCGNDFKYAGLEYGRECYCGNTLQNGASLSSTSGQCVTPCAGMSTNTCGGPNAVQLYSNANYKAANTGAYTSTGCVQEVAGRALRGAATAGPNMTIETCTAFCASQGFKIAGLEYGQECYCDNSWQGGAGAWSGQCNMPCAGNAGQNCGGPNAINVYTSA